MKYTFALVSAVFFMVLFLPSNVSGDVDSPRVQMLNGIEPEDVVCEIELQLMIRSNGDAICAKLSSVDRWQSRGMASIVTPSVEKLDTDVTPEKILVKSARDSYALGSTMVFSGESVPNEILEVSLEDNKGNEVFVDILEIDDSGVVYLEIPLDDSFSQGAYFLVLKQGNDSEIVPVEIGDVPDEISAVVETFHNDSDFPALIEIYGPSITDLTLQVLDSHDDLIFEDKISLGESGFTEYSLDLDGYKKGIYSLVVSQSSEETIEEFTVDLRPGTAPIEIQIDDTYYKVGETILLKGKSSDYTQILIELIDPLGEIIDRVEYYTDNDGKFFHPLEISLGKQEGFWTIKVSNAERSSEITFEVIDDRKTLTIHVDNDEPYKIGDHVTISGNGINSELDTIIQIKSSNEMYEIIPNATIDGSYSEVWQIPDTWDSGTYTILIDDGVTTLTTTIEVIYRITN